ncbi:hypothetical protein [Streptacidiphilus sp. EB103A]|uniref:hypothetical protein n=1 Tax=Streptacidiphilus sp. EB103A TaxID=3156275 RepID=UPI003513BCD9
MPNQTTATADPTVPCPTAFVELALADGTCARWSLSEDDPRIERMELVLGAPDTLAP